MNLPEMEKYARERHIPVIPNATKELLFNTVRERKPSRILEIGTAIGYSGIVMLQACPEAFLNTIELNEQSANSARKNFEEAGVANRVNVFVGDAREIVTQLTGSYDFVFLDGPKGQYQAFFPYLSDLLVVGGTLFCDDVLYLGYVEQIPKDKRHKHITIARNMHAFLSELFENPHFSTELFRIDDGVTISTKLD